MTPLVRKNHVNTYAKAWLTETIVNEIEEECKKHNIEVHNHIILMITLCGIIKNIMI